MEVIQIMRSIQELADELYTLCYHAHRGNKKVKKEDCSQKLWTVIQFTQNKYKYDFLQNAIDAIKNEPSEINKPEDVEPVELADTYWNFDKLWEFYTSNTDHYYRVQELVQEHLQPEEIKNFCQKRFFNLLMQQQQDEVFHATLAYLFEAYETQEFDEEDEDFITVITFK
jgi:hypothetical protein